MAAESGASLADAILKRNYQDGIEDALPDFAVLMKRVKFKKNDGKMGQDVAKTVRVRHAHGHTVGTGVDSFNLNAAIPGKLVQAVVKSMPYVLREQIPYTILSRTETSEQAVESALDAVIPDMLASATWYHEAAFLYGQTNFGVVGTIAGSGTSRTWTMAAANFAPGLYMNAEGMELDCFDPTFATQKNTEAAIVLGNVDIDGRILSVTGDADDLTACLATDVLVPRGVVIAGSPATFNWYAGIDKICTNTGILYGVNAAQYAAWKASTLNVGGAMTLAKLLDGSAKSMIRAGMCDLAALFSTGTFSTLSNNEAALRQYVSDNGGEFVNGAKSLKYYGANGGSIEIISHPMVKNADGFLVDFNVLQRVGSSDLTFEGPNAEPGHYIQNVPGVAANEIQLWSDQAPFCTRPSRLVKFTGITNGV